MRVVRFVLSFVFVLVSSPRLNSQQSITAPQRDAQAQSILSQMSIAMGWIASQLPADTVVSGTMARANSSSAPFTLKARGCNQFRVDTQDVSGPVSTVVNGNTASLTRATGVSLIPAPSAFSLRSTILPFYCVSAFLQNPNFSAIYAGSETIAGQTAYRVDIASTSVTTDRVDQARATGAVITVWIAASTWQPVQMCTTILGVGNSTAALNLMWTLSDYRTVSGIAIPFHQEATIRGQQPAYSVQLNSVAFNTGLGDSNFAVSMPTAQ
jgi:hypothetical protein